MTNAELMERYKNECIIHGYARATEIMRQLVRYQWKSGEISHDQFIDQTNALINAKTQYDMAVLN